jgi:hypothetical protein
MNSAERVMSTNHFVYGATASLIKEFTLTYSVSGEALGEVEVVQVVARLPFCLYLPSSRFLFPHPQSGELVGLVAEKVWTDRAEGSTVVDHEAVVPGQQVYLANPEVVTEWMGNQTLFTSGPKAKNMEFDRDPTGYFRYTRVTVELDWEVPSGFNPYSKIDNDKQREEVVGQISSESLEIINHMIDVYRVVTGDVYIERIPYPVIEDIRIGIPDYCSIRKQEVFAGGKFSYKCGYHPNMFSAHGIRPAMISKAKEIIDAFRSSLGSGLRPHTYELLRLNAQGALDRSDSKLAVIESFLSLEVYVEQLYYRKLSATMSLLEIEGLLTKENNWRLRTRLSGLLRMHFSRSVSDMDNALWEEWIKVYDQRNDLVHRNIVPTLEEAQHMLHLNNAIIQLVDTI